jgi:hypothetical protein
MASLSLPVFRRMWRGERDEDVYGVLRYALKSERGRRRAYCATLLCGYLLCATGWAFVLLGSVVGGAVGILWFVSFGVVLTVYAFAWPRFLVPPHMRP